MKNILLLAGVMAMLVLTSCEKETDSYGKRNNVVKTPVEEVNQNGDWDIQPEQ